MGLLEELGVVAGTLLLIAAVFLLGFYTGRLDSFRAIDGCEANLPRDQHCVIIAVPENEHRK